MRIKSKQRQRELIAEYEASGQTLRAWCSMKGIPQATFSSWRRKQKLASAAKAEQVKAAAWVQVTPVTVNEIDAIKLTEPEATAVQAQVPPSNALAPSETMKASNTDIIKIGKNGWVISVHAQVSPVGLAGVLKAQHFSLREKPPIGGRLSCRCEVQACC